MKIVTIIARVLLGLIFVVFGSNAFLNFIPMPPLPATPAGNFANALMTTHYMQGIAVFEVAGGLLLIIGRYVPLGLTLLGPVIVNIVMFHVFMERSGAGPAVVVSLLALFLLWRYRAAFAPLLRA